MRFPISSPEKAPENPPEAAASESGIGSESGKRFRGHPGRRPGSPNGENIRVTIEPASADLLRELAGITRLSLTQITNTILAEALKRVELIPTTLYDFKIK